MAALTSIKAIHLIHQNNFIPILKANKLLLNPPFSYDENGMPFIAFGLDKMEEGGLAAIIIQDSAGSSRAIKTNQAILKNTL